jgi:TRAP-type C4-dicarboxylate transport system permease small subunit
MHFVFRFFDGALRFAVPSCIAVIMLVIGMQVIARATVGAFSWPEELSVMLMIWALMLASVYVLNERGHVGITVLVDRFGPRNAALVSAVMHLLIILFCVAVIYGAVVVMSDLSGK